LGGNGGCGAQGQSQQSSNAHFAASCAGQSRWSILFGASDS
jgi:hypothetical protein